jgi:hypothetical protein
MEGDAEQIAKRFWENILKDLEDINSKIADRDSYPESFSDVNIGLLKKVLLQIEILDKNFSEFMEKGGFQQTRQSYRQSKREEEIQVMKEINEAREKRLKDKMKQLGYPAKKIDE